MLVAERERKLSVASQQGDSPRARKLSVASQQQAGEPAALLSRSQSSATLQGEPQRSRKHSLASRGSPGLNPMNSPLSRASPRMGAKKKSATDMPELELGGGRE
jgi:hypothetical protein